MKKTERPDFKSFKDEALKDEAVRLEYERLRPEFEVMCKLIKARQKSGYSQLELAERLDLQQPAIARLERGGYTSTSISKLARIADALGYAMKVSLVAKKASTAKQASKKKTRT